MPTRRGCYSTVEDAGAYTAKIIKFPLHPQPTWLSADPRRVARPQKFLRCTLRGLSLAVYKKDPMHGRLDSMSKHTKAAPHNTMPTRHLKQTTTDQLDGTRPTHTRVTNLLAGTTHNTENTRACGTSWNHPQKSKNKKNNTWAHGTSWNRPQKETKTQKAKQKTRGSQRTSRFNPQHNTREPYEPAGSTRNTTQGPAGPT